MLLPWLLGCSSLGSRMAAVGNQLSWGSELKSWSLGSAAGDPGGSPWLYGEG